jgi:hypothetical protein
VPRRHLLWILLAFAVSVGVRAPLLDRPLSAHHEYCTALVLIILHNWQVDGFMHHHGAPAITFSGPADLIPPGYTDAPALHDGVLYYLSHPPLAYDLPHLLFTLTGTSPNALGLQLFNLFFHLLTAIALYLIVRELLASASASNAPLFAALLYLFMPAPLWFHSNVYMSDMFVQNAWVWHMLGVLRMYRLGSPGWRWPLLAGATLFITTSISWPGVWAGMVLFGVALFRWWRLRDRQELRVMLMAVIGVGLALGYTAWRWLQVVDADVLMAYLSGRYADRGTVLDGGAWSSLKELLTGYRTGYLPVILVALGLALSRWRSVKDTSLRWPVFLMLAAGPVLLDHILLLQYAGHDFAALKGGVLLCALAGICLAVLRAKWAVSGLVLTCVAGVLYFYRTNSPSNADLSYQKRTGEALSAIAGSGEVVFTLGFTADPQMQWYAKRTLLRVDSMAQARTLLRAQGTTRGVVFQDGYLLTSVHISE